ncbi:S9 family peptidase [Gilvimarinus sp. DA14]|uniref:alpha/beta hydrolase family protein n=1 Tax=Gilvimarinus sp. DA14 TaxID=2956798 RepID=UPI0020B7A820|nr:alpha/beta hydrolase fold domain-containing protein [Gilvimarinus sp. DA14]UTF61726.1 alpha/beta hydrolase fold domain-containing protein [Gilvimarinus sp. DA14]
MRKLVWCSLMLAWASGVCAASEVNIHTVDDRAVADSYVEVTPRSSFNVYYDVALPSAPPPELSFSAHYFYVNGSYVAKRNTGATVVGVDWKIHHPAVLQLYTGETETLEVCIGDISNIADKPLQYCHAITLRGEVSLDTLSDLRVDVRTLNDGQDYEKCDSAYYCHFYADIFFARADPWVNDYRTSPDFPGAKGEPASAHINYLTFDFYYPNSAADGEIDSTAPKPLIVLGHSASKSKETFRLGSASILKFLLNLGYAVAVPDFRHPLKELDEFNNPLGKKDMAKLVQFLHYYAATLNIDPTKIVLTGNSLGGGVAVHSAYGELADPQSSDPVQQMTSRPSGVWVLDSTTVFSPNWIRENFLEAPVPGAPDSENAYLCYYPELDDGGNYHKYGYALGEVDTDSPYIGLSYMGHPADLSMGKLGVDDLLACPTITSPGNYDLIHLANYGEQMVLSYQAAGIGHRASTAFGQSITSYYYGLVGFINSLPP